jgi:hypothetical protein
LQARGLGAFRASALARSGWLVHLTRGVYMLPGDTLTRDGSLAFLSMQTPGFHVGQQDRSRLTGGEPGHRIP